VCYTEINNKKVSKGNLMKKNAEKSKTLLAEIQKNFTDNKGWDTEEQMLKDMASFRREVFMEQNVMQELVAGILTVMQEQVVSIILYGSVARGTNTEDSDVDVALLIKGELNSATEDMLSDFIVDMNLKYNKVFSVIDIDIDKFSAWETTLPFYQNMKKEGIVLWKAA
jgi:predicted nucleotidyltransferase